MDLHSIMNSDNGAGRGASRKQSHPPPTPLSKGPSASPSVGSTPHTPIQSHPQRGFRDYGHPVHPSPGQAPAPPPHEYHPGHPPPGPPAQYVSPTSQHPPAGAFGGRPAPPPPLQPPGSSIDPRSPGSAHMSGPSPYRHTPTSSLSASSQGYPFPPAHQQGQLPPSPQHRHQYGPAGAYQRDPRDSYASAGGSVPPPVGMPTPHGSAPYMPGQQNMPPQTIPATSPGGHPYAQQQQQQPQHSQQIRSHSIQSNLAVTPTSAHPQPFGTPYGPQSGSPVVTSHSLPHYDPRDQRQSSQPPTPLGPPAAPRQLSAQFAQPQSPYQQRNLSTASAPPPQSPYSAHQQPPPQLPTHAQHHQHHQQPQQRSPAPPYPPSLPHQTSHNSHYDAVSDTHRRSQSLLSQERERSLSVSPKTRIPSITESASGSASGLHRPSSMGGAEPDHHQTAHASDSHMFPIKREGTPAKRKLEDRDLKPEELDSNNRRPPPPPQMNGNHGNNRSAASLSQSSSPVILRKRILRHKNPPIWAQSGRDVQPNASRNYTLKSKEHIGGGSIPHVKQQVNGDTAQPPLPLENKVKSEHLSRNASPEVNRKTEERSSISPDNKAWKLLNAKPYPIEPISLSLPFDHLTRVVADFLFQTIVGSEYAGEVKSRGIQWEVEAKLGTIVDRNTNSRIDYPINGECALTPDARVAFRSSMTLAQHRVFNEWLNANLAATHPNNPQNRPFDHVPISYKHRREVDEFYELPSTLAGRLPSVLLSLQQSKQSVKGRITRDQQTGEILAKIVKARVADLNIHLPMSNLDCRISVNLEYDWEGTADEIIRGHPQGRERQPDRAKDRMSYTQGYFQVDLTQVSHANERTGQMEKEHELEVEMNGDALIEQGTRASADPPQANLYPELIETFVNNIRALSRHCPP